MYTGQEEIHLFNFCGLCFPDIKKKKEFRYILDKLVATWVTSSSA